MATKIVEKPWGRELWYARTKHYVGKILVINRGHRLSRQYHRVKHETVYALKGKFQLEVNGRKRTLRPGSGFDIAPGVVHRFEAPWGRATLLEVSTPQVADTVRLADDYGRVSGPARRGRKN